VHAPPTVKIEPGHPPQAAPLQVNAFAAWGSQSMPPGTPQLHALQMAGGAFKSACTWTRRTGSDAGQAGDVGP
jgi:hypothetical protein